MKTLVYHTGALGDFITILPSLVAYRKLRPEHSLIFLGKKAHGDLVKAAGYFTEVFDIDQAQFAALFSDQPSTTTNAFLAGFDEAISFAVSDSPIIYNLLKSKINKLHQQPPFPDKQIHVIDYHLTLFPEAILTDDEKLPSISINSSAIIRNKNQVVIHPGSGSKKKNWPLERFIALADLLKKDEKEVEWILGPAESHHTLSTDDAVIREPPLIDLCQLLQTASLFVGNDSGVAHLAAACGCACVVLFGPSDPAVWAPRGKNIKIISLFGTGSSKTIASITVDEVENVARKIVAPS